jgi:rubrerythrin
MPVHECSSGGKPGYQWGDQKCYTYEAGDEAARKKAKQQAYLQGAAIEHEEEKAQKAAKYDKFIDNGDGLIITPPKEKAEKAFTDPFPEGEPEVLVSGELVRALQLDIAAEQDAAALYMAHADKVIDVRVKETLRSVAREELVHVGEFEALIDYITGGAYSQALGEGVAEVHGADKKEQPVTSEVVGKSVYSQIQKVDDLRHWVTGVVLEPETVDLQGDVITKEDVRRAMEGYMLKSQAVGRQHEEKAKASVVECYLAPEDFRLGGRELVRKDSWVMTVKIFDEGLWDDVTKGKITGFSIGGKGIRSAA